LDVTFLVLIFFPTEFLPPGDSNNVALVSESINFLKSSLEKTENGLVKIRGNKASENREQTAPGKAANNSTHLNHPATNIKDEAAMHMLLACKRNVILYDFFRIGMFSLAAHNQPSSEKHLGLLTIFCPIYVSTVEFRGPVYTRPEKFENAALFLRLGLPSTLIRHVNGALVKNALQAGGI